MRRRDFIAIMSTAVLPALAHAQQTLPVVGFLNPGSPDLYAPLATAFVQGLQETGYTDRQNVTIDYRWAAGRLEDLPRLASALVERRAAVVATSGSPAALAMKAQNASTPFIFVVTDPVRLGLVQSQARPGGNATGVDAVAGALGPKRLGLLRELVPTAKSVGLLVNPESPIAGLQITQLKEAAQPLGLQLQVFEITDPQAFDATFAKLAQQPVDLLVVAADPFFNVRRRQVVALAARHRLPATYEWREFVDAGGLMSYGVSLREAYRQMGVYAGLILKGAKPADLPVIQPTRFEFVINLNTAKALGLAVPASMQLLADEVIE